MGQTETAWKNETIEKMEAAGSPAEEKEASSGSVSRRPFVLEKRRGSGSGNLALMLLVVGAIVVLGIGMVVFLSTKGTVGKKLLAESNKPNLGQTQAVTSGGDLVPNDKVKPTPNGAPEPGSVEAADIERTKSPHIAQTPSQGNLAAKSSRTPGSRGEVGKFEEPDTAPISVLSLAIMWRRGSNQWLRQQCTLL